MTEQPCSTHGSDFVPEKSGIVSVDLSFAILDGDLDS